jgi:hypothetical protein
MIKYILATTLIFILSGCSSDNKIVSNPITGKKAKPGIFSRDSEKGISLNELLYPNTKGNSYINVNGYLWRASLNVLSIAPLISTDALGGTIITDWYINKNIKNQRLKITAMIKTAELRSDGIDVKVHFQDFKNNSWSNVYSNNELARIIEENILNEARNLRTNSTK